MMQADCFVKRFLFYTWFLKYISTSNSTKQLVRSFTCALSSHGALGKSRCFELFLGQPKLGLKWWGNSKNNVLLRKKNIKGLILKQKGTRVAEDGGD